jgi:hypothetical protein
MRPTRLAVAVIILAVGLVWLAQGLDILPGSAMSGSLFWAATGAACVVAGAALGWVEWGRRRTS